MTVPKVVSHPRSNGSKVLLFSSLFSSLCWLVPSTTGKRKGSL